MDSLVQARLAQRRKLRRQAGLRLLIERRIDAIRTWPKAEQREWRQLLDTDPRAALLIAELAYRLDARLAHEQLELELAA